MTCDKWPEFKEIGTKKKSSGERKKKSWREPWVNCLGILPRNSVVRFTDCLDMTIVVDWDVKPQINQTNIPSIYIILGEFSII